MTVKAENKDITCLAALYAGRRPYYGELHDHASTGGTSDGKNPLKGWKEGLAALGMDFATTVDHKQVRHMYLPEWDSSLFIGGTESGAKITDDETERPYLHYNMFFARPSNWRRFWRLSRNISLRADLRDILFTAASPAPGLPSWWIRRWNWVASSYIPTPQVR